MDKKKLFTCLKFILLPFTCFCTFRQNIKAHVRKPVNTHIK